MRGSRSLTTMVIVFRVRNNSSLKQKFILADSLVALANWGCSGKLSAISGNMYILGFVSSLISLCPASDFATSNITCNFCKKDDC